MGRSRDAIEDPGAKRLLASGSAGVSPAPAGILPASILSETKRMIAPSDILLGQRRLAQSHLPPFVPYAAASALDGGRDARRDARPTRGPAAPPAAAGAWKRVRRALLCLPRPEDRHSLQQTERRPRAAPKR